jgi:hypothetical protein
MMTTTAYDYRQLAPGRMYLSGGGRDFGGAFRGVDPERVRTTDELLAETGLDWGVMQGPVYTHDPWGQLVEIENRVANIRDDNGYPLGVVGKGYRPLVNRDGLGFADALVQNGEGGWIGAVESGGGAKVSASREEPGGGARSDPAALLPLADPRRRERYRMGGAERCDGVQLLAASDAGRQGRGSQGRVSVRTGDEPTAAR